MLCQKPRYCDIAPSADAAARLTRYIERVDVEVRPHTEPAAPAPRQSNAEPRAKLRMALIGAIGTHKGYQVLLECSRDARKRKLPLKFVVIGHTENDAPLLDTGKVFITGEYREPEASHLIQRENPDIAWLPSVWPETWCYTLDYALAAGVPVAAFDLGAIAERLRAAGGGLLLPLELEPRLINDRLIELAGPRFAGATATRSVQTRLPPARDDDKMTTRQSSKTIMAKSSNA